MSDCNILVLVSGGGTNLQALLDAGQAGEFKGISVVIADRPCYALERAKAAGVPTLLAEPDKSIPRQERRRDLSNRILALAESHAIDLIVLAGFLSILAGDLVQRYSNRIINLHPSLLPKFGGDGMYGEHVHRAVLEAGENESGCTVHLVDSGIDTGAILLQRRVPVLPGDTPALLAARIHAEEHIAIVEAVKMIALKHR